MTPYIIFRIIIALLAGAVLYIIDRQGGTGLYRWWYGMTHEHPLPGHVHRGFVHNRGTKNRVIAATILSSIIAIVAIMYAHYSALLELGLWLLSIPVIVGAFMVGPRIDSLWSKRDDMYSAVDKWERGGEAETPEQLEQADAARPATAGKPVAPAAEAAAVAPEPAPRPEPSEPPTTEVPQPEPETDPQELVNRFINRGNS